MLFVLPVLPGTREATYEPGCPRVTYKSKTSSVSSGRDRAPRVPPQPPMPARRIPFPPLFTPACSALSRRLSTRTDHRGGCIAIHLSVQRTSRNIRDKKVWSMARRAQIITERVRWAQTPKRRQVILQELGISSSSNDPTSAPAPDHSPPDMAEKRRSLLGFIQGAQFSGTSMGDLSVTCRIS
ncbi:hypothetical protein GY45DRAFT_1080648 [Cubamyces sp. BRFM 1775]|nr:hypothetical protein GY45DRAFT_1080648 [Cubamyces sp. BRFM 1775]